MQISKTLLRSFALGFGALALAGCKPEEEANRPQVETQPQEEPVRNCWLPVEPAGKPKPPHGCIEVPAPVTTPAAATPDATPVVPTCKIVPKPSLPIETDPIEDPCPPCGRG